MRRTLVLAGLSLLCAGNARAWLSSSLKEHQGVHDRLRDSDSQVKSALDVSEALQGFNSSVYALRTAVVAAMQAQAATANCAVNFPALYQDDHPEEAQAALARAEAQADPLKKTAAKLRTGLDKIRGEAEPLAKELRDEDMKARAKVGGAGTPSGRRADTMIADLKAATNSGLDANKKGEAARESVVSAAQAELSAVQAETQAAQKNRDISGNLNQICSQIKALPKDPTSLPASIAAATALAAQGLSLHQSGMPPLTQAAAAIASAKTALEAAKKAVDEFGKVLPGNARPESADLPYVSKANDVRAQLADKMASLQKEQDANTGAAPPSSAGAPGQ